MSEVNTTTTETTLNAVWLSKIAPFASAIKMQPADIALALTPLTGEPSQEAFDTLTNDEYTTFEDLATALPKVPKAILKKAVNEHLRVKGIVAPPTPTAPSTPTAPTAPINRANPFENLLPTIPADDDFLSSLKIGGKLLTDPTNVISAIKSAILTNPRLGLDDLAEKIINQMEEHANEQGLPCDDAYYELQNFVSEKKYGEVLSALKIKGGTHFVTEAKKRELLSKINRLFWPALYNFFKAVQAWNESYKTAFNNPMAFQQMMMVGIGGMQNLQASIQTPDTQPIRDSAEALATVCNQVFAVHGVAVARALAHEATRLNNLLKDPRLPPAIGATSRDDMLKKLKVNVTADLVRLERNLARFTLAAFEFNKVNPGQEEVSYIIGLTQVGAMIHWDTLFNNNTNSDQETTNSNRRNNTPFRSIDDNSSRRG